MFTYLVTINSTVVSSIKKTPFEVVFGQKPNGLDQLGLNTKCFEEYEIAGLLESEESNSHVNSSVDFCLHQTPENLINESDSEKAFETTCEKRKCVREKVAEEIVKNVEMMKKKYMNGKRVKVATYNEGDNVTLAIPKKMRHASDLKRLPCVVIGKSGGNQPTYKLVCQEGTIQKTIHSVCTKSI